MHNHSWESLVKMWLRLSFHPNFKKYYHYIIFSTKKVLKRQANDLQKNRNAKRPLVGQEAARVGTGCEQVPLVYGIVLPASCLIVYTCTTRMQWIRILQEVVGGEFFPASENKGLFGKTQRILNSYLGFGSHSPYKNLSLSLETLRPYRIEDTTSFIRKVSPSSHHGLRRHPQIQQKRTQQSD